MTKNKERLKEKNTWPKKSKLNINKCQHKQTNRQMVSSGASEEWAVPVSVLRAVAYILH